MLNYNQQFDIFEKYSHYKYGLFYIHGNFASGQYWLSKRFAWFLTSGEEEFEIIKVEESKQHNSDTIERMENRLRIDTGQLFSTLAGMALNKKLVFLIDENDPLYFINNFWCGFLDYLDKQNITESKPLFVFLYDSNENKNCQVLMDGIKTVEYQVKQYTFPFVEIAIPQENISKELIEDWWKDVRKALPELKFPCTPEQLTDAILQKTSVISEEVIRIIIKKFGLRYIDIVELIN